MTAFLRRALTTEERSTDQGTLIQVMFVLRFTTYRGQQRTHTATSNTLSPSRHVFLPRRKAMQVMATQNK